MVIVITINENASFAIKNRDHQISSAFAELILNRIDLVRIDFEIN